MAFKDLVLNNRSCRRFKESEPVTMETLRELVDLARKCPSGANMQPLKYALCNEPEKNAQICAMIGWAAYLKDWPGPADGERPAAYITVCLDTDLAKDVDCDHGIASQTIMLGAVDKGLAGCMLGNVKRDKLHALLNLPANLRILLVLALGVPAEERVLDELAPGGDIRYWRDAGGVHHVPKRGLDEIIIG